MPKKQGSFIKLLTIFLVCLNFSPAVLASDKNDLPTDVYKEVKEHLDKNYPFILVDVSVPIEKLLEENIDTGVWLTKKCIYFKSLAKDVVHTCYELREITSQNKSSVKAAYFKELEQEMYMFSNNELMDEISHNLKDSVYPLVLIYVGNLKSETLCTAHKLYDAKVNECIFEINEDAIIYKVTYIQVLQ